MANKLKTEREKKTKKIFISLDELGKGLHRDQVDVKLVPWRNTWEMTSMMMERQEQIIDLLEDIKTLLQKQSGETVKRKAPAKKKTSPQKAASDKKRKLKQKVDGADYNTLRKMCKTEGLKASGKKDELKKQLYKQFKLR